MNDVSIIDHFLNVFSTYIDSGFGLLRGEVGFLTATLVVLDMTLAGLYWSLGHATGQGEDVMTKLIRKVLYVGAFRCRRWRRERRDGGLWQCRQDRRAGRRPEGRRWRALVRATRRRRVPFGQRKHQRRCIR